MSEFFKPKKQVLKSPEQAYAELLGNSSENQIVEIAVDLIDEIDNQPQKIHEDKIERIVESMKIVGQLDPIIVIPNPKKDNRYILIAGRHRKRACIKLGLDKVKAVIRKETNPDKQRLMLLATNNDRNTDYSPSELAFSYKEQMDLLLKLGSKSTASQIAQGNNTNRKTVHKYIQLTKLIPPLLSRVDSNSITVGAGYELSFLSQEQQTKIFNFMLNHPDKSKIDKDTARLIRLSPEDLQNIFYPLVDKTLLLEDEENITSEEPKAEKKINSNISETNNCPPERHLPKNQSVSFNVLMMISFIIKKEAYSILLYIISNIPTTDELIELINRKYVTNGVSFKGNFSEGEKPPYYIPGYEKYSVSFKKKLIVTFTSDTNEKGSYKLSYAELDTGLRKYLRKYVSAEDKILAIKEAHN